MGENNSILGNRGEKRRLEKRRGGDSHKSEKMRRDRMSM